MGSLLGLQEYLDEKYDASIFNQAMASAKPWEFYLHGRRTITATVLENGKWNLTVNAVDNGKEEIQKVQVKYLHPSDLSLPPPALCSLRKPRHGFEKSIR